jgi:hypothetical protein
MKNMKRLKLTEFAEIYLSKKTRSTKEVCQGLRSKKKKLGFYKDDGSKG